MLEADLTLVKRTVTKTSAETVSTRKMKVTKLKTSNDARSAKELENILQDMEQYFAIVRIPTLEQVTTANMYLSRDAKLWWQTRIFDDANAGRPKIDSQKRLKKEIKDQFLPCNASWVAWVACDSLKRLRNRVQ